MEKISLECSYISKDSGGYVSRNSQILDNIDITPLNISVLNDLLHGTPIYRLGKGGRRLLIIAGIHGNELPPQIAAISLLNDLHYKKLKDTVYIIPCAAPKSTMMNVREYNNRDLNRSAHIHNSLSNLIIQTIDKLKIDFVGDFHSTALGSNPGYEAVFSTQYPTFESILIAKYISADVGSEFIAYSNAGGSYKGAIEDESNLMGIPAITGEVLCPFGKAQAVPIEHSLLQMKSFLSYFGVL